MYVDGLQGKGGKRGCIVIKKNRLGIELSGFDELMETFENSGGKVEEVVERCLEASSKAIAPKLHEDMKQHYRSGKTESSIIDNPKVEWEGTMASIKIGFDIKNHGLASIFLMYGTPRMPKDMKLYRDIYGPKVRKEIAEQQERIFEKEMSKLIGE